MNIGQFQLLAQWQLLTPLPQQVEVKESIRKINSDTHTQNKIKNNKCKEKFTRKIKGRFEQAEERISK